MAHVAQALAELAKALGSPQQRRLRIASRLRLDQRAQIIEQVRIRLAHRPTTAARPAYPFQVRRFACTQFGQPASDRAARDTGGTHNRNDPTMSGRCRLGCRKTPPTTLVEHRSERLKALAYGRFVNHLPAYFEHPCSKRGTVCPERELYNRAYLPSPRHTFRTTASAYTHPLAGAVSL